MPNRVGKDDELVGGQPGVVAAVDQTLPAWRRWAQARIRRCRKISARRKLARPDSLLRILPRRQRRGAWRQSSNRLDWAGGQVDSTGLHRTSREADRRARSQVLRSVFRKVARLT